ncbi:Mor transcription activator family protein [Pseudanabaena mucicola]|uniref:Mor transcription activator domain-containing protein n=1 Tax=Pseudanabaena mucicola FACHB-723 TaxID=2692860 RepID=A0ABR8A2K1_9CYAN|nr:Mor transcription activator family protein [Pseudanabaena mucicola]MBD2189995.1 hypothetical protein [Pseudanabaena mucicola FACHB-723]
MIEKLPPLAQEIRDLIGLNQTLLLVQKFGGTRIYIPPRLESAKSLIKLLGRDDAQKMIDRFKREQIVIPRCTAFVNSTRDRQIMSDRALGLTVDQVARKYRLSRQSIQKISSGYR